MALCIVLCLSAAKSADLPLPPAIQNAFRIGGQPKVQDGQSLVGFGIGAMAFDAAGNMYVAGHNLGAPFAVANQTFFGPVGGSQDLWVMKISGSGERILYSALIGTSQFDQFGGMAVDRDGNVFLAGSTLSPDFPTTPGSYLPHSAQGGTFVLKLDASGQRLIYSTYIAPASQAMGLAIDTSGNAYIAGAARAAQFPTTAGAYQTASHAVDAGFVSELSADGKRLLFSTLFAGSEGGDYATAVAVDANGVIQVTGRAVSPDFPVTSGGSRSVDQIGNPHVFLARFDNTGSRLLFSTVLFETQNATALTVDRLGNSYVAGQWLHSYVTKFDGQGKRIFTKTIGGARLDNVNALLALDDGTVMIGGDTTSPDFPTRDTLQPCTPNLPGSSASITNGANAFVTILDPAGEITLSSLLGGVGYNSITVLAPDPAGSLHVAGDTTAPGFPGTRDLAPGLDVWAFAFEFDLKSIVPGRPAPSCIVNGASYKAASIAPGMVATIYGSNLGPEIGIGFTLGPDGRVPTSLAGMSVTVGGTPAPILYAQDRQMNFVVPQQVAANSTSICVAGAVSSCVATSVALLSSGIFGAGSAILNEDGTVNTPTNPALRGSVISFFGTGMGPYTIASQDGVIAGPQLGLLQYHVDATFYDPTYYPPCSPFFVRGCPTPLGPFRGEVKYAGQAPEMVTGVTQVNVKVPADAIPGPYVSVSLAVSGPSSQSSNTTTKVAVK